jgi:hypothetical protein
MSWSLPGLAHWSQVRLSVWSGVWWWRPSWARRFQVSRLCQPRPYNYLNGRPILARTPLVSSNRWIHSSQWFQTNRYPVSLFAPSTTTADSRAVPPAGDGETKYKQNAEKVRALRRRLKICKRRIVANRRWRTGVQSAALAVSSSTECPICLEELQDTRIEALTPCGHFVCAACATLAARRNKCLVCLTPLGAPPLRLRGLTAILASVRQLQNALAA